MLSYSLRGFIHLNLANQPEVIEWLFDGNFNDVYGNYNGQLVSTSSEENPDSTELWSSPGYAGYGSAVNFSSNTYALVDRYLNLTTGSFTIAAWIWLPNAVDSSTVYRYFYLLGHCEKDVTDECLHVVVGNGYLRLGFFDDDLLSVTRLTIKRWYHIACVYDRAASKQLIYLNGILDNSRTSNSEYRGDSKQLQIGPLPALSWVPSYNGLIDKLTFVLRAKTASELLDEATLVAYYPFDGSFADLGPNQITNISNMSTTFDDNGRSQQALVIGATGNSCFQTTGYYYLGQSNYSFSFSLWIYLYSSSGTILTVVSYHIVRVLTSQK
jgi:hypothetical protein